MARQHTASKTIEEILLARQCFQIKSAREIASETGLEFNGWFWEDVQISFDGPAPSEEDLPFAVLAWKLNNAAFDWALETRKQSLCTPEKVAKLADEIAKKTANLHDVLTDQDGGLLDTLGSGGLWAMAANDGNGSGRDEVANVLTALENLERWSQGLAERERARRLSDHHQTRADLATKKLMRRLGGIYWEVFGREPGVSSHPETSEPHGPFFRFSQGVLAHLDVNKSNEGLRTLIKTNL